MDRQADKTFTVKFYLYMSDFVTF